MSLLKVNQLTVMRGEDVALVDNVSLTLEAGEMLGWLAKAGRENRDLPGADAPAAGGRTADYRR
jgi:ABC-type antimicrobial peptide transport system ATPase subunit